MNLRAIKNESGIIIGMSYDDNQSGNYPSGSSDENKLGIWCNWVFENAPDFSPIEGLDPESKALRFKENISGDGIEIRSDAEVLANPNG